MLARGRVYIIGPRNGPYKIGITNGSLKRRIAELQVGSPVPLLLHFDQHCSARQPRHVEAFAHLLLVDHHSHGEWFACSLDIAIAAVKRAALEAPPTASKADVLRAREQAALAEYRLLEAEIRGG